MKVPEKVYSRIKHKLWDVADKCDWTTLTDIQKSALYEEWIRDEQVGEALSRFLSPANVRVYLKDTVMKAYAREKINDFSLIMKLFQLPENPGIAERYIKPHGRKLIDGKVICWGFARDWKTVLFAVYERAHLTSSCIPYAAVLMSSAGKHQQPSYRKLIENAANRLGIVHVKWYDA